MGVFRYAYLSQGVFECELNLSQLYEKDELAKFWNRYEQFCVTDLFLEKVIRKENNTLIYSHKSWVPAITDNRPKILFLFGNPAPHSVSADIYFAYEGGGREHRFWRVMRELKIIDISLEKARNGIGNVLKDNFLNLKYASPFIVGMEVFFTFPSSASNLKWSGVMGLQRLFGKKAFSILAKVEKQRVNEIVKKFLGAKGKIIAFQKDAYNGMLKEGDEQYSLKKALSGNLHTNYDKSILLVAVPPTRWMHTMRFKKVLKDVILKP